MNRLIPTLLAGIAATGAEAGGVERALIPLGVLFEEGNYAELSFTGGLPDVSGTEPDEFPYSGDGSGDMSVGFGGVALAFKTQATDQVSLALFYDEPFGANIGYPSDTGYYAEGATAELDTEALTAMVRYQFPNNISVYGGLRYQTLTAEADLPYVRDPRTGIGGYTVEGDRDGAWGYLVGAAYERPDIALRVALTYSSAITHELDTVETSPLFARVAAAGRIASTTEVETPQSVTLDFQTGIAADTLLFGSVRWAEWTEFEITPQAYSALSNPTTGEPLGALVEYEDDRWTYALGLGRQLNETWAVAGTVGYEPSTGSTAGNLGPTDGFTSVGFGVTYTNAALTVTTGIRYVWLGDAETPQGSDFDDNEALGGSIRIGYSF